MMFFLSYYNKEADQIYYFKRMKNNVIELSKRLTKCVARFDHREEALLIAIELEGRIDLEVHEE